MQIFGHQIFACTMHYVVSDQGFAMHYRAVSNKVNHLDIFWCGRVNTVKQKDGLTSFLMFNVLEAKDLLSDRFSRRNNV